MFSGAGVFADGLMIALVVDGVIYLKADDADSIPAFEREGLRAVQLRHERRQAHADFVLADAGAALRRAGRTGATGRGDAHGAARAASAQARHASDARQKAKASYEALKR